MAEPATTLEPFVNIARVRTETDAFTEAGSPFDPAVAERLQRYFDPKASSVAGARAAMLRLKRDLVDSPMPTPDDSLAALAAGDSLKDPAAYVRRLNKLLVELSI